MSFIRIRSAGPLEGQVKISGSKNAALPILAASLLGQEEIILEEVPQLRDVEIMFQVLKALGCKLSKEGDGVVRIDAREIDQVQAPDDLMDQMRASFVIMGPLLARMGRASAHLPGGCAIGKRPIDLHLKGFRALGAEIEEDADRISARAPEGGLKGGNVYLDYPSVGATQNIMIAACQAKGETWIENAAREPEIVDLANFLTKLGAKVRGAGTSNIVVEGVDRLGGCHHTIIPDRIEASTFLLAGAMTGGDVLVKQAIPDHIRPVLAKLSEVGCRVDEEEYSGNIRLISRGRLQGTRIRTLPYPGFPTDVQAPFMALMTICEGQSRVAETVFENRFKHVDELNKMGALIVTEGNEAIIRGVDWLKGASVKATDLRAAAALVLAGLVADGQTEVHEIYHLDRGYVDFEEKLRGLGADIERINEEEE